MDEKVKKKLERLEERIKAIEEFLSGIEPFEPMPIEYEKGDALDELYDDAVLVVLQHEKATSSILQRRLQIGFLRAVQILDQLEANGVIGKMDSKGAREVLIKKEDIQQLTKKHAVKKEKKKTN